MGEMENCTFETLTITQNKRNGRVTALLGGNVVNSFKVSFTVKQTRFGTAATNSTLTKVKDPNKADPESESGAGGKLSTFSRECRELAGSQLAPTLTKGGTTFSDPVVKTFINSCIVDKQGGDI